MQQQHHPAKAPRTLIVSMGVTAMMASAVPAPRPHSSVLADDMEPCSDIRQARWMMLKGESNGRIVARTKDAGIHGT